MPKQKVPLTLSAHCRKNWMTQARKHRNQMDVIHIHFVTKISMARLDALKSSTKERFATRVWSARAKCAQSINKKVAKMCVIVVYLIRVWHQILMESKGQAIVSQIFSIAMEKH